VDQSVYFVDRPNKRHLLLHVLKHENVTRCLVFTRTKAIANRVTAFLNDNDFTAEAIHGNKSQNARQRALDNFKNGRTKILVASDLAARGIDVEEISHVINYDLPNVAETYVHRIGRTGRAFATGRALSFCDAEEKEYLRDIEKLTRLKVPVITDHPFVGLVSAEESAVAARNARGSQNQRDSQHRRQRRPGAPRPRNDGKSDNNFRGGQAKPKAAGKRHYSRAPVSKDP
jgi:ATP-dependent RNA helicase RhlE